MERQRCRMTDQHSGANDPAGPALLSDVLGILAHDLRNPIAALLSNVGYLNMVGRGLPEDVRETIGDLELSVEALARMMGVLELLAGEVSGLSPARPPTTFGLDALLDGVWPSADRAAASHGVRLERGPIDADRLSGSDIAAQAALQALLHNAIMCAPQRSTVRVFTRREGDKLVLAIEDDGPALASKYRGTAFSLRGPVDTKGKLDGRYSRGLGLYVAGREARLASAELNVPELPKGNRFELVFAVASPVGRV